MARGQLRFSDDSDATENAVVDALAAFGLAPEEGVSLTQDDEFWLWPENEAAFLLWLRIQTQWNWNMHQPTGLNYVGIETCMRLSGIRPKERERLFEMMQVMEDATLQVWSQR